MTDSVVIEKVARAICLDGGFNPDERMPNDGPRWKYYETLAQAAIAALKAEGWAKQEWMPISEAPKDGTPVLLWKAVTKEHYVAAYINGGYGPGWCTPDGFEIFNATHFMPLPPAPKCGACSVCHNKTRLTPCPHCNPTTPPAPKGN